MSRQKTLDPPKEEISSLINLYKSDNFEGAIEKINFLYRLHPNSASLLSIAAEVYCSIGKLDEAIYMYQKVLKMRPDNAKTTFNYANTLKRSGKINLAIDAYQKAIEIDENYFSAHFNLANALNEVGQLDNAILIYLKALKINPAHPECHNNLGNTYNRKRESAYAEYHYSQAIKLRPNYAIAWQNLGLLLHDRADTTEALNCLKNALRLESGNAEILKNIGIVYTELGEFGEALKSFFAALELNASDATIFRLITQLKTLDIDNTLVTKLKQLIHSQKVTVSEKAELHYAYAKIQEDNHKLAEAYKYYVSAAQYKQQELGYTFKSDKSLFSKIIKSHEIYKDLNFEPNQSLEITPVFIVGMPRSGTTLTEQILSNHPFVSAAGELDTVSKLCSKFATGKTTLNCSHLSDVRTKYLNELRKFSGGMQFVTDKMPQNFLFIGLILKIFPEAKVIHLIRDSQATCWSNFKQYFQSDKFGYSYNINDTVDYYKLYRNLMQYWNSQYPGRLYNCDYENLTINPLPAVEELLTYLNLEWDDKCLSPETNYRPIKTASQIQVTNTIYKNSSKSWKKFQTYLAKDNSFFS